MKMAQAETFSLSLPSNINNVKKSCEQILEKFKKLNLSESDIFDLKLSIEEATINAVKYGNRLDENLTVDIKVLIYKDRIEITVRDSGKGFDYNNVPDPTENSNLIKSSGRGLFLIRHLMDEVRYNDKGNEVTIVKYIK